MSGLYAPACEHSNAVLMAVQWSTVDCCAAETLRTFVEGPRPLANLDNVGETSGGIARQCQCHWEWSGLKRVTIARWQHRWVHCHFTASENCWWQKHRNIDIFTDARPTLFIVVSKVTQVPRALQMVATELRSGRDSSGGSIECDIQKEVSGESIVVLSWKGHFCRTQTWLTSL